MQLTNALVLVAAGLASAAVQGAADTWTSTTSSTTTIYQTVTITRCNPAVTNCPASATPTPTPVVAAVNTSSSCDESYSSWGWPARNSTQAALPTGSGHFSNSTAPSWSASQASSTSNNSPVSETSTASASVPTGAAAGRFVQSGMMLGLAAAGVAILA